MKELARVPLAPDVQSLQTGREGMNRVCTLESDAFQPMEGMLNDQGRVRSSVENINTNSSGALEEGEGERAVLYDASFVASEPTAAARSPVAVTIFIFFQS